MTDTQREKKRSLLQLVSDIPTIVRELVAGEIELLKSEMLRKLKDAGVGVGLLLGACIVLLGVLGVLLTVIVLALSTIMPGWIAGLVVAFALLIVAAIIGLIGYRILKKGIPPLPTQTIDGLQKDLRVIKGVGKRATP